MTRTLAMLALSLLLSTPALAGSAYSYVEDVRVDRHGRALVKFTTALSTPATCINGHWHHLAFDANTAAGRSILALVLTAQATGQRMLATGTGTCSVFSIVETWENGWIDTGPAY